MPSCRSLPRRSYVAQAPISETVRTWMSARTLKIGLGVLSVLLSVLYVLQMNMTASKGYEIRQLDQTLAQLQDHAKDLKLQALELQSLDRIDQQLAATPTGTATVAMVQAPVDGFMSLSSTAVATR